MNFRPSSLIFLTTSLASRSHAAVFDIRHPNIGHVRTDPILDQECLSGHVHTFYGPKSLFPTTDHDVLRAFDPYEASGNIVENNSLYWHPSIYRVVDGKYELQETSLGVYYIWDKDDTSVRAFPPGFKMIAGGVDKIDPRAELNWVCESSRRRRMESKLSTVESSFLLDGAICGEVVDDKEHGVSYDNFPEHACSLFVEMKMPNCWNGQDRDDDDSHVTYSDDGFNEAGSSCPEGFDKIPQIWLFIDFPNGYKGGEHVFSDGSQVLHVDYLNGWNETVLEDALRHCESSGFEPHAGMSCSQFTYKNPSTDFSYAPDEPFDTTQITLEEIDDLDALIVGTSRGEGEACTAADTPFNLS